MNKKTGGDLFSLSSDIEEGDHVMAPRTWVGFAWGNDRTYNDGINRYSVDGMGILDQLI